MSKIALIIKREYTTRVRKRSFIIMTIVGPILFATMLIAPYKFATLEDGGVKTIAVVELNALNQPTDSAHQVFRNQLTPRENLRFVYLQNTDSSDIGNMLDYSDYDGILLLRQNILHDKNAQVEFYATKQPSAGVESYIVQSLETVLYDHNLMQLHISPEKIDSLKTDVSFITHKYKDGEFTEQDQTDQKRGIGYAAGFLIYFFIFFFGAQVMRGVIEEKTNRIIEVIITSVKPFQLMMGKIGGIALVALTQFAVWIFLTLSIYQYALPLVLGDTLPVTQSEMQINAGEHNSTTGEMPQMNSMSSVGVFSAVSPKEIAYYLLTFLFYFIGGYLLYGSMFAAIGAAVDSETDTQQFMLPVTIPLILSIIVMVNAITNPEGQLVLWFSMIPFTSPVVMMARIPFHPPMTQLLSSIAALGVTFVIFTWIAAKVYRTGILMYGKKPTYRELWRWIRFKD